MNSNFSGGNIVSLQEINRNESPYTCDYNPTFSCTTKLCENCMIRKLEGKKCVQEE